MATLRSVMFFGLVCAVMAPLPAQTLPVPQALKAPDVTVEAREDGYHLFVKASKDTASLLLTEAFELPDHKLATYALRSLAPNSVHANQTRLLNGKPLTQPHNSLVTSTKVNDPVLGEVFHLLIPPVVEYGNSTAANSRSGRVEVRQNLSTPTGTFWFSIRAFAKPYADYTAAYRDNAFELRTLQRQTTTATVDHYEKGLVEGFSRLGTASKATDIDDALQQVTRALDRPGDSLDMVLVVDTTKSMIENLKAVKANLLGPVRQAAARYKSFRIGLVFYRDYMENYLTQVVGFQSDFDALQAQLNKSQADGGGDIPEAVVEAMFAGLTQFTWKADSRVIIVLGDAPQHPSPRGTVTEAQMRQVAQTKGVELQLIMLPQTAF